MEKAVFRPPMARAGWLVLAGAAAGLGVAMPFGVPPLFSALFGAAAAGLALAARQAAGLRVVASEGGVEVQGGGSGFSGRWAELQLGFGIVERRDGALQRYVLLSDLQGRGFAFAEMGGGAAATPVRGPDGRALEVVDLREAAILLGVAVQRVPTWELLPDSLREGRAAVGAAEPPPVAAALPRPAERRAGLWGMLAALGSKVAGALGKVGAGALKVAKTASLPWAAASVATYSILFSWKFALAIMLQLFVHEYGHVHAMRRTGMRVRGMYFVPFIGALAVTDDSFRTRRQQAYVALAGPIWGSALALVPAGLYLWTGAPTFAAVAAWWALINLFNLLPIAPLDGGRVMHAFAFSWSSSLGMAVSILGLLAAVTLGVSLGFSLLWLVALLGALELLSETQARAGGRGLRLLPEPARFGPAQWVFLRSVAGVPPGSPSQPFFLAQLDRQDRAARAAPMTRGEAIRFGLAYVALAGTLMLLVWTLRQVPGASAAAGVLT